MGQRRSAECTCTSCQVASVYGPCKIPQGAAIFTCEDVAGRLSGLLGLLLPQLSRRRSKALAIRALQENHDTSSSPVAAGSTSEGNHRGSETHAALHSHQQQPPFVPGPHGHGRANNSGTSRPTSALHGSSGSRARAAKTVSLPSAGEMTHASRGWRTMWVPSGCSGVSYAVHDVCLPYVVCHGKTVE